MRIINFFRSYENWVMVFFSVVLMDGFFTVMGLSYGFREANPLIIYVIQEEMVYYPFVAGAILFFMLKFNKLFWIKKWFKVFLWLSVPFYFYLTSIGWLLLLT